MINRNLFSQHSRRPSVRPSSSLFMYLTNLLQRFGIDCFLWSLLSTRSKRSIAAGVRPFIFGVLGKGRGGGGLGPAQKSTWLCDAIHDGWIGANGGRILIDSYASCLTDTAACCYVF